MVVFACLGTDTVRSLMITMMAMMMVVMMMALMMALMMAVTMMAMMTVATMLLAMMMVAMMMVVMMMVVMLMVVMIVVKMRMVMIPDILSHLKIAGVTFHVVCCSRPQRSQRARQVWAGAILKMIIVLKTMIITAKV